MLNEIQLAAFTEILNVGAGRAAQSLSEIVGDQVSLSVPSIKTLERQELKRATFGLGENKFASVTQTFDGPFSAEGLLLVTEKNTLEILREIMGTDIAVEDLSEFEQEGMCELGNIILNACLSAMADMFGVGLTSGLPRYAHVSPQWILRHVDHEMEFGSMVILHIDLVIKKRDSEGHLIFFLTTDSSAQLQFYIQLYLEMV